MTSPFSVRNYAEAYFTDTLLMNLFCTLDNGLTVRFLILLYNVHQLHTKFIQTVMT